MCGPNLHYARCLLCIPDILETNCRLSGTRAADASLGTFGRPRRARSICSAKSRKSSHLDASGIQISGRYRGRGGEEGGKVEGDRRGTRRYNPLRRGEIISPDLSFSFFLLPLYFSPFFLFLFFFSRLVARRGITGK